jgi:DNA-directed RNA polymerase specialized sigma24 family protein
VAMSLAAFDGLSSKEIAVRMKISPNAVRCHLMRGRKRLRDVAVAPPNRRLGCVPAALAPLVADNS